MRLLGGALFWYPEARVQASPDQYFPSDYRCNHEIVVIARWCRRRLDQVSRNTDVMSIVDAGVFPKYLLLLQKMGESLYWDSAL